MKSRIVGFISSVLLALTTAACADKPALQSIPAPSLAIHEVKIPVPVSLPVGMMTPCPEPPKRDVRTDVQLLELTDAFKVWGRCNAAKLKAIEDAQP